MNENPPYLASPGSVTKSLEKIKAAAAPERFTSDFVSTILGFKGGAGRALTPFYKRMGFVKSDGTPSPLYHEFRNPALSKKAAAEALKIGYSSLFERNEYIHKASDEDLKGVVVELTGLEADSPVAKLIVATFKNFRAFCDFDGKKSAISEKNEKANEDAKRDAPKKEDDAHRQAKTLGLNLAYSINLHLPASDDIKVFDAIFKSLKENLLNE